MNKTYYVALLLLTGCTSTLFMPSKTIRNEQCYDSNKIIIVQALEDGALGYICPTEYPTYYHNSFDACYTKGDLVFIQSPTKKNDFVDDQKITLDDDKCLMPNGIYKYTTIKDVPKTVRKVKIIESQVENPEYVKYLEDQEAKSKSVEIK